MRRILPWALLGVLGLGIGAGAALGQFQSPGVSPTDWVAHVVATTAAAGSAHFAFTNSTTSPDRSQESTVVGTGIVDFTNSEFQVTENYRQNQYESTNGGAPGLTEQHFTLETIGIGQTVYRDDTSFPFAGWTASRFPRDVHQVFGLDAANGAEDALSGLAGITPIASVRTLGPGSVDGVAATRYEITNEPLYVCGPKGRTIFAHTFAPTTMWVDGQGRLLRVRTRYATSGYTSHGPLDASGRAQPIRVAATSTDSTLTFSGLGQPVHIAAPSATVGSGSASISIAAKGSTTPCHR